MWHATNADRASSALAGSPCNYQHTIGYFCDSLIRYPLKHQHKHDDLCFSAPSDGLRAESLRLMKTDTIGACMARWRAKCFASMLLLGLLVGGLGNAFAGQVLNLVDGTENYPLGLHLSYFEDKEGRMSLQEVLEQETLQAFTPSKKAVPSFSFTKSSLWFRLDLHNQDSQVQRWLLECLYPPLDSINVYVVDANNNVVIYRGGDKLPFYKRAIKHRNVMFNIPLAIGDSVRIYIRVRTDGSLQVPLALRSPRAILAKDHEEQFALGLFYGVLVAMLLYNLLIFMSIRDISYLYYVGYIVGWVLFQMSLNGLAFEYLWPESPKWGNMATPFFVGFALFGALLFTRVFLETRVHMPRFDRLLKVIAGVTVLVMVTALVANYGIAMKLGTAVTLVVVISIISAGLLSLKIGVRQARFFMLAWSALLLGILVYALKTFGVLPSNTATEYGMQLGSAAELILLSFALAHRMRLLKEDNERIQRDANESLERRVQERTQELDEALLGLSSANEKLKDLSHIDGLTAINNRAYFNEQFEFEWQRAMRIRSPMGLLMIDVDHFKRFNDTYGHLGGDSCLKVVAQTIQQAIKRPADRCYRYGGEEFSALLPHTDLEGSLYIAETICRAIEALDFRIDGNRVPVTISVGVSSVIPERDIACEALIAYADQALYQAKRNGRNRVESFVPLAGTVPAK
jgi:diguanylate cyclase (GGDEF)-like protein